jgi:MFS family permease
MLGRKRIYGYEVLVLALGAVASAFSPNIWWLIFFRIILGIGIEGDNPRATLETPSTKTQESTMACVDVSQFIRLVDYGG